MNISSIARHGNRGQTNYVAAKAALAANTRTWMKEFAPYGIRVAAVAARCHRNANDRRDESESTRHDSRRPFPSGGWDSPKTSGGR